MQEVKVTVKVRRILISDSEIETPDLGLPSNAHTTAAIKWYFLRFPGNESTAVWIDGELSRAWLEKCTFLSLSNDGIQRTERN